MNRGEAINQLNLERKRRENDVWEKWFLTETRGEVTSGRLLDRTNELNKLRDDYDKSLQRLNEQPAEKSEQNLQRTPRNVTRPTNVAPRIAPGTENLPENQPLIPGQEVRPKSQVTQVNNQNEPHVVRQAREENRREEVDLNNDYDPQQPTLLAPQEKTGAVKKSTPKLSVTECFVLIFLGIITDLINLIPFLNIIVNAIAAPCFALYFRARGVFIGPSIIAGIVEFIPAISVLPATTLGIVITILYDRFGGKVLEKIPLASKIVQK